MLIIFLAIFAVGIFLWDFVCYRTWSRELEVESHFTEEVSYEGRDSAIITQVSNRKRLPVPILEARFVLKKGIVFPDHENSKISDNVYKRDIYALRGMERITRTIPIHCAKRGHYELNEITLRTMSTFFHSHYDKRLETHSELYVYPKRVDVGDLLSKSQRMLGSMPKSKQLYEDPFAFRGIREYTMNDPMKTINWKATAKTGDLMVNTFDSTMIQKVHIFLDLEDAGIIKHDNFLEENISVAATLSSRLMKAGMDLGISMNTKDRFHLNQGSRSADLTSLERRLAEFSYKEAESCLPFEEILEETAEDVMCIFISHNPAREEAIRSYLGKERSGLWVRVISPSEEVEVVNNNLQIVLRKVW